MYPAVTSPNSVGYPWSQNPKIVAKGFHGQDTASLKRGEWETHWRRTQVPYLETTFPENVVEFL